MYNDRVDYESAGFQRIDVDLLSAVGWCLPAESGGMRSTLCLHNATQTGSSSIC